MGSSGFIEELERNANAAAAQIRQNAQRQADAIGQEAAREITDRRTAFLKGKEAEYRAQARAAVASMRHTVLRDVLAARDQVIRRVLDKARGLLPGASESEEYIQSLDSRLTEALQFVEADDVVVLCAASLLNEVRAVLKGREGIAVKKDPEATTGFIVTNKSGSVRVDDRLEVRLSRLEKDLAIEILSHVRER